MNKALKNKAKLFLTISALLVCWFPLVFLFESISLSVMRPEDTRSLWQTGLSLPAWYWVYYSMLFSATLGVCISIIYYRRYIDDQRVAAKIQQDKLSLELQLSQLRMKSLLTQLEPHFLFNALNSISSLVRISEKQMALNGIKKLSDLLRYAVQASDSIFVSFDSELKFVEDYLNLQALRFEDKLSYRIQDSRTHHGQECPPFLLQIFVENAIRHGLEASGQAIQLEIKIDNQDKRLNLQVNNTHQQTTSLDTLGIGLTNLQQRLAILYGDDYRFAMQPNDIWYQVTLSIPETANH